MNSTAVLLVDCPDAKGIVASIANRFQMEWRLEDTARLARVAIFVSRFPHCLVDLLHRHQTGELRCDIALIASNHLENHSLAAFYRVPFHHVPVEQERKAELARLTT